MINEENNKNVTQEVELEGSTTNTNQPAERALSLILTYPSSSKDAAGKGENGNLRILSDELLALVMSDNTDNEEANKLREEFQTTPALIENNPAITAELYESFSELLDLYTEIEGKRNQLLDVNLALKNKLQALKEVNKIVINEEVFDSNEASINRYVQLIEELIKEVREEVELFAMLIQAKKTYLVHASATPLQNPFEIVINKIKSAKRYIKNVRRDINVSYSRYSFGLNAQMKQISYFEMGAHGGQK